jgi:hypothetical protein
VLRDSRPRGAVAAYRVPYLIESVKESSLLTLSGAHKSEEIEEFIARQTPRESAER